METEGLFSEFHIGFGIALLFVLAGLGLIASIVRSRKTGKSSKSAKQTPQALGSPELAACDAQWSAAINELEALRLHLKDNLYRVEQQLETDLQKIHAVVEDFKQFAKNNRISLTLFELYESTRNFDQKPADAQARDLAWHAKAGITDLSVGPNIAHASGKEVTLTLEGQKFHLAGASHVYSGLAFTELTLSDAQFQTLMVTRVSPQQEGQGLAQEAVVSMKPGVWITAVLACRAKMDARLQEVQLGLRYKDIAHLRANFSGEVPASGLSARS